MPKEKTVKGALPPQLVVRYLSKMSGLEIQNLTWYHSYSSFREEVMEHVYGVIEGVAVAAITAGFTWLIKMRKDIDAAFVKIRNLENEFFGPPLEAPDSCDRSCEDKI